VLLDFPRFTGVFIDFMIPLLFALTHTVPAMLNETYVISQSRVISRQLIQKISKMQLTLSDFYEI